MSSSQLASQTGPRVYCPAGSAASSVVIARNSFRSAPTQRQPHLRHRVKFRKTAAKLCAATSERQSPTSGFREIDVTLKRPLGVTLAEDVANETVFVEEVVRGGNAEKSGKVAVGDVVAKVSATVLKAGKDGQYQNEGYGQRPYDNWDKIMFDCTGQDFKTVMSAIDSNNPRWGINDVTLVLKRKL